MDFKQFLATFCDKNRLKVAYTDEEEDPGFYSEVSLAIWNALTE